MIRGVYTAISGIIAAQRRMDVLGNNIANVNTTGFKEALATQSAYTLGVGLAADDAYARLGSLGLGTYASGLTDNWLQGPILTTGLPTDLAIAGDGLFVVGTPSGPAYTRNGALVLDASGMLTTQIGQPVLDVEGRPIVVPGGASSFAVAQDGTVAGTGQRIALVAIPATGVTRLGDNLFALAGPVTPVAPGTGLIRQGALEGSNTDLAGSMVELISVQRSYQLSARAFSVQDGTLETTNGLGRVR
jgi:flagellar basal-body rod protein FlgG